MYAVARAVILGDEDRYHAARREFAAILAQAPGWRGTVSLDTGAGRHVSLAVWESDAAAQAAPHLGPHYQRLLAPHTVGPGRVVDEGPVVTETLTTR